MVLNIFLKNRNNQSFDVIKGVSEVRVHTARDEECAYTPQIVFFVCACTVSKD